MSGYRLHRGTIVIVATLLAGLLSGCSIGVDHIFTSPADTVATPEQAGMSYEDVWFFSPDRIQLHGWLIPSQNNRPLVLFFHGNATNISFLVPNLHYLHRLGLPIFIFDYRGYGTSRGQPLDEEDFYQDARGALRFLAQRGWNPERMIYLGQSLGAAIALQMALERPPAGIVLESPFTSLRAIARKTAPLLYALFGWWHIGDRFDNLGKIPRLNRPVLIIHGKQDRVIPPAMSQRLFSRANEPKTLILLEKSGHHVISQETVAAYSRTWLEFIDRIAD